MSEIAKKLAEMAKKINRDGEVSGDKARIITTIAKAHGIQVIPEDIVYPTPCHLTNFCIQNSFKLRKTLYGVRGIKGTPKLLSGILDHRNLKTSRSLVSIHKAWKSVVDDYTAAGEEECDDRVVLVFRMGSHILA